MDQKNKEILDKLAQAVIQGDVNESTKWAQKALDEEIEPLKAIEDGLAKGIKQVGEAFGRREAFLTELARAGKAMKMGMDILSEEISRKGIESKKLGTFLIGTVEGDIHDIGKNLVSAMLTATGFKVIDLGVDVSTVTFVNKVKALKPDILGLSALTTATKLNQKEVINALISEGLKDKVKVMIGGAPTSKLWADEIGADGYGSDALDAANNSERILKTKQLHD